jgi:hypothetical protein
VETEKQNLWILTEERSKKEVIKTIIEKSSEKKKLEIEIENLKIIPSITDDTFNHIFLVEGYKSKKINNIFIKLISGKSSFVDFLIFLQNEEPNPEQILENCFYAIEETKTSTYESRNTAMGQRSSKFSSLNYYIQKHNYKIQPVMYFSSTQAEEDNRSVNFVNRLLCHLESGIEFWGKDSSKFKKFKNLKELIKEKNDIAKTNTRTKDTPIKITIEKNILKISCLLANPGQKKKKKENKKKIIEKESRYTGRIGSDPNIGQVSLIAKGIRSLGWKKRIVVTHHQVKQERIVGNKFTNFAKLLNIELENCILPPTEFNLEYWSYVKDKEKVASILGQIILENKNMITIFDNHGGCEKSYFHAPDGNEIQISKEFSRNGGKIPDLVIKDDQKKLIYIYECKKIENIENAVEELNQFELFEKNYLKTYYPDYISIRGLIINGGKPTDNLLVKLQLTEDSKVIRKDEFN